MQQTPTHAGEKSSPRTPPSSKPVCIDPISTRFLSWVCPRSKGLRRFAYLASAAARNGGTREEQESKRATQREREARRPVEEEWRTLEIEIEIEVQTEIKIEIEIEIEIETGIKIEIKMKQRHRNGGGYGAS